MEGRLTRMPHVNELHEQHDQLLVVSFASGDLAADDRDRATAQSLVESCADCARLHDDVLAIARATRALPPPVRTRDFQISPEQAAKLQPGGWRRFVAAFSAPGSIFSKQLKFSAQVQLTTLGQTSPSSPKPTKKMANRSDLDILTAFRKTAEEN